MGAYHAYFLQQLEKVWLGTLEICQTHTTWWLIWKIVTQSRLKREDIVLRVGANGWTVGPLSTYLILANKCLVNILTIVFLCAYIFVHAHVVLYIGCQSKRENCQGEIRNLSHLHFPFSPQGYSFKTLGYASWCHLLLHCNKHTLCLFIYQTSSYTRPDHMPAPKLMLRSQEWQRLQCSNQPSFKLASSGTSSTQAAATQSSLWADFTLLFRCVLHKWLNSGFMSCRPGKGLAWWNTGATYMEKGNSVALVAFLVAGVPISRVTDLQGWSKLGGF